MDFFILNDYPVQTFRIRTRRELSSTENSVGSSFVYDVDIQQSTALHEPLFVRGGDFFFNVSKYDSCRILICCGSRNADGVYV